MVILEATAHTMTVTDTVPNNKNRKISQKTIHIATQQLLEPLETTPTINPHLTSTKIVLKTINPSLTTKIKKNKKK